MDYKQIEHFFFGSKTRVKILVRFVIGSKRELYLREISRKINVSAGNTRRELLGLEHVGLLKSRKEGNLKYYSLDTASPLYRPFREIVIKTIGIPFLLKLPLTSNKNIIAAFIYGSFAKGGFDNKSDIDIFILTKKNSRVFEELYEEFDKFEQKFAREINISIIGIKEFSKKMLQGDQFIEDIIKGKKIFLKGGQDEFRSQISGFAKS